MNAVNVIIPIIATLIGAGLTYALNIRTRRTSRVDDLYTAAEAAVYEAAASVEYLWPTKPDHLSANEYDDLLKWCIVEGLKHWRSKVGEANLALARLRPICPQVERHLPFSVTSTEPLGAELLTLLRRT